RFKVLAAGRRWGKTLLGVTLCVEDACTMPPGEAPGRAWWVAPSYKQAAVGWRALLRLLRPVPGVDIRRGEMLVKLPTGGTVQVRSADEPDSLRGEGLTFLAMDEAAYMAENAWSGGLRPGVADGRG